MVEGRRIGEGGRIGEYEKVEGRRIGEGGRKENRRR